MNMKTQITIKLKIIDGKIIGGQMKEKLIDDDERYFSAFCPYQYDEMISILKNLQDLRGKK